MATAVASKPGTRASGARKTWHTSHAIAHLTIIWYELWLPALAATLFIYGGSNPYLTTAATLLLYAKLRKSLAKNLTDTMALGIRRRWNHQRANGTDLPALITVQVDGPMGPKRAWQTKRMEGWSAVCADHMQLTIRPNDHQGDQAWTDGLATWCRRRYGFQMCNPMPSMDSSNLINLVLAQHRLPGIIEADD
jgi:hypothetical protein